jgi:hypothetical protein
LSGTVAGDHSGTGWRGDDGIGVIFLDQELQQTV